MRAVAVFCVFAVISCGGGAFAQTPKFEVASVKRDAAEAGSYIRFLPGGRMSAMRWVKQLVQVAYGVEDYQVSGGPAWLSSDRYLIEAKAENADASKAEMTAMLKSLLVERFQLRVREESREFPVLALVVMDGGKLRPLKDGEASRCGRDNSFICGIRTVGQLAKALQHPAGRAVVDQTGIEGQFDILLDFDTYSSRGLAPPADYDKPSLTRALQEQLGLRLESRKVLQKVVVVEGVQRPTEN